MKHPFSFVILVTLVISKGLFAHPGVHDQITLLDGKISKEESYTLYAQRAHLNFEGGDYGSALHDLDTASKLGPKEPLLYEYGNVYTAQGKFEEALKNYDQFIKFNARLAQAFQKRAEVLIRLKRIDDAIKDLKHSFRLQKHPNPGLFIETAELIMDSKNGSNKAAIELLDHGMKQLKLYGALQEKAIEIEMASGYYEEAVNRMYLLGKERKKNPFWRVDLAELLIRSAKKKEASKELEQAFKELQSRRETGAVQQLLKRIDTMQTTLEKK